MSCILSIDVSGAKASIALYSEASGTWLESSAASDASHSEELTNLVADLTLKAEVAPKEINQIVVGSGPGSFTGLRIGFSFVKGLALANGAKVTEVDTFYGYAYEFREKAKMIASISDARRGEVFLQIFVVEQGGFPAAIDEAKIIRLVDVSEMVNQEMASRCLSVNDLVVVCSEESLMAAMQFESRVPCHLARSLGQLFLGCEGRFEQAHLVEEISALCPKYIRAVNAKTIEERQKLSKATLI